MDKKTEETKGEHGMIEPGHERKERL